MKQFKLVATAASGMEALVGKELRDLGIECQVENGKAIFHGDLETIATANLGYGQLTVSKLLLGNLKPPRLKNYSNKPKPFRGKIFYQWMLNSQ